MVTLVSVSSRTDLAPVQVTAWDASRPWTVTLYVPGKKSVKVTRPLRQSKVSCWSGSPAMATRTCSTAAPLQVPPAKVQPTVSAPPW